MLQKSYMAARENLQTPTTVPIFCLENRANKFVLLYDPPTEQHLENHATICCTNRTVWPSCSKEYSKTASKNMSAICLEFCALLPCCTDCTDPYSTAFNSKNTLNNFSHINSSWDLCPISLEISVNFATNKFFLFLSKISQSLSCTLP
jgi:hypothetical protein